MHSQNLLPCEYNGSEHLQYITYLWQFNDLFTFQKIWPSIIALPVADEQPWHQLFPVASLDQLCKMIKVCHFGSLINLPHLKLDLVTFERETNTLFQVRKNKHSNAPFLVSV